MNRDAAERTNDANRHPAIVSRWTKLLEKSVVDGRSARGAVQKNAVEVKRYAGDSTATPKRKRKAKQK